MPCLKSESKTKKVKISLPWERMIWTQGILSKEILYLWPLPRPGGILMPGLFWTLDPRYHAWYGGYFCNAPSWRYSQYAPPSNNTSQLTYCPKWFAEQTFIKNQEKNKIANLGTEEQCRTKLGQSSFFSFHTNLNISKNWIRNIVFSFFI